MKRLPIFLIAIGLLASCSNSKNRPQITNNYENKISLDSVNNLSDKIEERNNRSQILNEKMDLITSFFSDIYHDKNRQEIQLLMTKLLVCSITDSLYFFKYSNPIHCYKAKGVIYNIDATNRESILGNAIIFLLKDNFIHAFEHPMFELTDYVFEQLDRNQINIMDYKITDYNYFNKNQIGILNNVPFGFFDIDFDNEKELILRYPGLGQRFRSVYMPMRLIHNDSLYYKEYYITEIIDSIRYADDEYGNYPSLDDQTEFDYKNKFMILDVSGGIGNSEKQYYKIIKGKNPELIKTEIY